MWGGSRECLYQVRDMGGGRTAFTDMGALTRNLAFKVLLQRVGRRSDICRNH